MHLLLNHFPILGSLFGLLLLGYGLLKKSDSIIESALFTFIVIAIISVPAFLSGEVAEEVVEHMNKQNDILIHEHEDAAAYGLWLMLLLGLSSLVALIRTIKKRENVRKFQYGIMLFSLIAFLTMSYVGITGGKIRHTEIRASGGLNQLNQIPK
ncbi:MAG: DUF2231 domain-containing protein [Reichenbachiella sp.]|uniref:DUF2231 domain-containing protein n=1 Tax=Reichenbachiella sp. TaxID=2184521 RepID=UPI003267DFC1